MDSFSATPVCYSSLEADDLDNPSDEEEFVDQESQNEDEVEENDAWDDHALRDRFVRPRFEHWLDTISQPANQECSNLLLEMFNHLTVIALDLELTSSERHSRVDFELYGMQGCYKQCSQADPFSATWETNDGTFKLKPNVEAELLLDGEALLGCTHFSVDSVSSDHLQGSDVSSSPNRLYLNKERISERFGSETLSKLGGIAILIQFLGVVCIDLGVPCYTEVLPFGLSPEMIRVMSNSIGSRASSLLKKKKLQRSPQSNPPSWSRGNVAAKTLSAQKAEPPEQCIGQQVNIQSSSTIVVETSSENNENGAYPSANATQTSSVVPHAPLPPKGPLSEQILMPQPSRPSTRATSRGSGRPSSLGRKAASGSTGT